MSPFRRTCRTLIVAFSAAAMLSGQTVAQAPPSQSAPSVVGDVVVNMRGADIKDVAEQISRITGRTIILDPGVTGTVNVVSGEPLGVEGVWDLFLSVLRAQGYVAVRSGSAWRVIPQASAVSAGSSASLSRGARRQDVVTRLIRLRNLAPDQAVRVLRPLVAGFGSVEAVTNPNAIVVTDYAENVRRIELLAQALDSGGGQAFESIRLQHANAADVAQAIERLLGAGEGGGGLRVAVDERSNIVLIRGDTASIREAVRMADVLDVAGGTAPITRVVRLNYADAESITEVLRGLHGGQGQASNPVARTLAAPAAVAGASDIAALIASRTSANASQGGGAINSVSNRGDSNAGPAVGFALPDITIQPAPELNAIVMRGSPAAIAAMTELIEQLDLRRPQVMIEAAIVEVTGDAAEAFGIQLGAGATSINEGSGGGTSFSSAGISLRDVLIALGTPAALALAPQGGSAILGGDDFSVLVQALGSSTKANLLSTPQITMLDNEPGEIVVGQNVPFITGAFTSDGGTVNPFTTIEREDVGITLRVLPRIHEGDTIRLEVSQEVSSLVNANVPGAADLITNRRSIETTVLADNGRTIVLGGLISDDRLSSTSQVPILGDIPVIGRAFRSDRESTTRRTLFIFLRPTILRNSEDVAAAADAQYERLRYQETLPTRGWSLLQYPPGPRLPTEIEGIY